MDVGVLYSQAKRPVGCPRRLSVVSGDGRLFRTKATVGFPGKKKAIMMGSTQIITNISEAQEVMRALYAPGKKSVFFGGAGVSVASGIPDFRSEDGLYHQKFDYPPEVMLSHSFYRSHRKEFFDFYRSKMIALDAKPNRCHEKLAQLECAGLLSCVITQNIDGLHQMAGSKHVLELHGSVHRNICSICHEVFSAEWIMEHEKDAHNNCVWTHGDVPVCPLCGGEIKPDVVLYEEQLDENILAQSIDEVARADTLVVGGTSLVVWPAAGLTRYFQGDELVIVNLGSTEQDFQADLILSCDIASAYDF